MNKEIITHVQWATILITFLIGFFLSKIDRIIEKMDDRINVIKERK